MRPSDSADGRALARRALARDLKRTLGLRGPGGAAAAPRAPVQSPAAARTDCPVEAARRRTESDTTTG